MLALAILVIVLAVGYSFNFYVNKSFTIASQQSEVQYSVRMATELIEDKVHFADYMKILENDTDVIDQLDADYAEAIYIENGSLMYYKDGTSTNLLENYTSEASLEIEFNKTDDVFLWYNVKGDIEDKQTYDMSSEIQIMKDVEKYGPIVKDFGVATTTGKAIIFGYDDEES